MSKMFFYGSDQHTNSVSLLSEVNVDECEDMFFEGDSVDEIVIDANMVLMPRPC